MCKYMAREIFEGNGTSSAEKVRSTMDWTGADATLDLVQQPDADVCVGKSCNRRFFINYAGCAAPFVSHRMMGTELASMMDK